MSVATKGSTSRTSSGITRLTAVSSLPREDTDKAEEYMIKAGEEALRSSASNEAIHYYQEVLNLYLNKYGKSADPKKIALLKKNNGIALYNKGRHAESLDYFYQVLEFYGVKYPKYRISIFLKLISGLFSLILALYFPSFKWKKNPTEEDNEILSMVVKKTMALGNIDPKRMLVETICETAIRKTKIVLDFDLMKKLRRQGHVVGISIIFSWTGLSLRLSRWILKITKNKIIEDDYKSKYLYEQAHFFYNYLEGNWESINDYDDGLILMVSRIGVARRLIPYLGHMGRFNIEKGQIPNAVEMFHKINQLAVDYENDFFWAVKFIWRTFLLLKYRKLNQAMKEAQEGLAFTMKKGMDTNSFLLHNLISFIKAIWGDIDGAINQLNYAKDIRSNITLPPIYLVFYYIYSFFIGLAQLEELTKNVNIEKRKIIKNDILQNGKRAVKISTKCAPIRTEAYRLMGTYYWLCQKQSKALKWWKMSIGEGERLGANLELSRTYFEVGKRLLEEKSKHKELAGIKSKEYLEKARMMFQEMDLQWDIDELDKIVGPA